MQRISSQTGRHTDQRTLFLTIGKLKTDGATVNLKINANLAVKGLKSTR